MARKVQGLQIKVYNLPDAQVTIESAFATVKARTKTTKGAGSSKMAEIMSFKLMKEAEKKWRKIKGHEEIAKLLDGAIYKDGKLLNSREDQQAIA